MRYSAGNVNSEEIWTVPAPIIPENLRISRGHDRMVVGFTTTNAISVYH
jgi:hypothetical protein